MTPRIALALIAALAAPASAQITRHGSITAAGAWSRATSSRASIGAGYVTVRNTGAQADRLVSATSPRAAKVEIHTMSLDDGIMRMRPLPNGLEVPAGGEALLAPGGNHIMLIGLKSPLKAGERVPATLRFARAGDVRIQFKVVGAGSTVAGVRQGGHQ
ncbi:copper chaperone PCu(A)C [Sphingomonas sp. CFBP 8760]|uniref:copper chaperone PCu(A)C n=1 Tax=Sphingomonas sp. CFBP 8760 TaxID=2775282 RepID=UPI00178328D8|nr:copper chaperone PCu(A)C [Sphingomonas sp. CFBP 8760]MBD8548581.1 copper chaperone PCu(A)C [Sphingomonas sp. CFBP 8760]